MTLAIAKDKVNTKLQMNKINNNEHTNRSSTISIQIDLPKNLTVDMLLAVTLSMRSRSYLKVATSSSSTSTQKI